MHNLERVRAALTRSPVASALLMIVAGCSQAPARPSASSQSEALSVDDLAKQCKLQCPTKGIAEGNASISGVASVDAFFQSVLDYQIKADNVSSAIESQLNGLRGDFGLDPNADVSGALMAKISGSTEAGLSVDSEPARCFVDTEATIRAEARCDASVQPGKVSCGCRGKCEVAASANVDCGGQAELNCTSNSPSVACQGKCQGKCTTKLDAAGACDGTCRGSCSGKCSAFTKGADGKLQCAGDCDGQCMGSCEVKLAAAAQCAGTCDGECTVTPPDTNCQSATRVECSAMADAMLDCKGRCQGEIEPPKAKAECEANAKAQAKLNVQCTPPRLVVKYKLKSDLDAAAAAQFEAAAGTLDTRLPALFAATAQAQSVTDAQVQLIGDGNTAVHNAINDALSDKSMVQVKIVGLKCALDQLGDVGNAIDASNKRLTADLDAAGKVQAALTGNNS